MFLLVLTHLICSFFIFLYLLTVSSCVKIRVDTIRGGDNIFLTNPTKSVIMVTPKTRRSLSGTVDTDHGSKAMSENNYTKFLDMKVGDNVKRPVLISSIT